MVSYNQLIKIQSDIAAAHLQIRSFGTGAPTEIGNNVTYPLMWSIQQPGSISILQKQNLFAFKIIFADLVNTDNSNEQEVLSDMQLVALDVITQLQLEEYADLFTVEPSARIDPFTEEAPGSNTADKIAGWVLDITLRADYLSDRCAVPSTLDPAEATPVVCTPVTVYNSDGEVVAEVGAGGIYIAPAKTASNTDNTFSEPLPSLKNYTIPDTSLVDSAGGSLGAFPSVTPITAPDATLKDTAGTIITTAKSGGIATLANGVAKNSLNQTVGTALYGQNISVGDSVILKANGITHLAELAATNNLTTTQIIQLMTAAEVLADVTTAGLMQSLVQSLTGGSGNLNYLTNAQLQALLQAQLQVLTNSQLLTLSTAQTNYIFTNLPVTSYERPVPAYSISSAHLYDGYWIRQNVLNVAATGKKNALDPSASNLLVFNNAFGNKNRFTDIFGTGLYSTYSNYMIDNWTGLGYYLIARSSATWDNALDEYATFSLVVNGVTYTNFFVPDIEIVYSIRRHDVTIGLNYAPFSGTGTTLWTGTPSPNSPTTRALTINTDGVVGSQSRSSTFVYILCRKHYSN